MQIAVYKIYPLSYLAPSFESDIINIFYIHVKLKEPVWLNLYKRYITYNIFYDLDIYLVNVNMMLFEKVIFFCYIHIRIIFESHLTDSHILSISHITPIHIL